MTNDIKKITARFDSTCKKCGMRIKRGETIIYFPLSKKAEHGKCGESEYLESVSRIADEDLFNNFSM